jgi:hypothetical protein
MHTTRARLSTAVLAGVLMAVLAPGATAVALPLPLPVAGAESLATETLTIEGPLVNNVSLPALR